MASNHLNQAQVFARLIVFMRSCETFTRAEMRQATGISEGASRRIVDAMRELRQVHICRYDMDSLGREQIERFAFGDEPDASKPRLKTKAEIDAAYAARRAQRGQMILQQAMKNLLQVR